VGYVDLHLHLLPGVDDGAQTLDDALSMARTLVSLGFSQAAPSPHHRDDYPSRDRALCERRLAELAAALQLAQVPLALELSAENYFLDDHFLPDLSQPGATRTIGASRVVLVEAPYNTPVPMLSELVFRMKIKGLTPLVAHPERCLEFERKGRAAELVAQGALLQLDLGATTGRYGKLAQKLSAQFLEQNLYAVAATDLHSPVGAEAWLSASLTALERLVGAAKREELLEATPRQLLQGKVVS
jgi:protein-tyrosine phosphatase